MLEVAFLWSRYVRYSVFHWLTEMIKLGISANLDGFTIQCHREFMRSSVVERRQKLIYVYE